MRRCWLAAMLLTLASCSRTAEMPARPAPAAFHMVHQPPAAKDIIDAVIASGDVSLKVSPTCANVGTEPSDATIGRYLAGFLAELSSPDTKNWIETRSEPGRSATGEPVSVCTLTLRHEDGNDRWGWGVQFHVRTSDGQVLMDSWTCVGAG